MKNLMSATAVLALLALTSTAALAQGPIGNCGNQVDSGDNPNGGGNTCGDDTGNTDTDTPEPIMFDMTGQAGFGGSVFGENVTVGVGDHTIAGSYLEKVEAGGAGVVVKTGQPVQAGAFALVGVQGGGFSGALSFGPGESVAGTAVLGNIQGGVIAGISAD